MDNNASTKVVCFHPHVFPIGGAMIGQATKKLCPRLN